MAENKRRSMVFLNSKGFTSAHKNFDALSPPRLYKSEKWWNLCERVSKPQTLGVNVSFSGSALFPLPHQSRDSPGSPHFGPWSGLVILNRCGWPDFWLNIRRSTSWTWTDKLEVEMILHYFFFQHTVQQMCVRSMHCAVDMEIQFWNLAPPLKHHYQHRPLPHYHQQRIVICNVGIVLTYTLRLIQTPLTRLFAFD